MKVLFVVYHGLSNVSGISKKIIAQVDGLKENGHDVRLCMYTPLPDGSCVWMVDGDVIKNYGGGWKGKLLSKVNLSCIERYVREEKIEFVYARSFHNANPFTIGMFRAFRRLGVPSVIEIPTYPYDHEYKNHSLLWKGALQIDRLFRHQLACMTDAIVTFTDHEKIFGQRTIRISNGIDFKKIPLRDGAKSGGDVLNVIAVAEVHYWHGFDRFIKALGEYYAAGGTRNIVFHIVGDIGRDILEGNENSEGLNPLIDKYGIQQHVVFHGALYGEQLNDVFDICSFAVASLARHRSGITNIKTLKNREYAARGFAFMYSETDSDFDAKPYVYKVPADESIIDIDGMLQFIGSLTVTPLEIRDSISELSWKNQMNNVVCKVNSMIGMPI